MISEGTINKDGHNDKPKTPRPPIKPTARPISYAEKLGKSMHDKLIKEWCNFLGIDEKEYKKRLKELGLEMASIDVYRDKNEAN